MELNIKDRLYIPVILPKEGSVSNSVSGVSLQTF